MSPRWLVLLLAGCAAETADVPEEPEVTPVECGDDVPSVTWETFGEGFVTTHCQGCHASTAYNRRGAPEAIVFDTAEDASDFGDLILDAAGSDPFRMPPAGGPTDEDRELLTIWLTCFRDM